MVRMCDQQWPILRSLYRSLQHTCATLCMRRYRQKSTDPLHTVCMRQRRQLRSSQHYIANKLHYLRLQPSLRHTVRICQNQVQRQCLRHTQPHCCCRRTSDPLGTERTGGSTTASVVRPRTRQKCNCARRDRHGRSCLLVL